MAGRDPGAGSANTSEASAGVVSRELVLARRFEAPRELVFAAWTQAEHFARWFGPRGFSISSCSMDARPGGAIRFSMGPEGGEYWHAGRFLEVVEPERVVFTLRFVDEASTPVPHPRFPGWPVDAEFVTTVTFAERDGGTEVTVHQVVVPAEAAAHEVFDVERPQARAGWFESFERLDELLAEVRA